MSLTADQQNKVHILFEGYSHSDDNDSKCIRANCTSTLIQTKNGRNIIVDTMTAWDGDRIVAALKEYNLSPRDINIVVCTHGHSDHIGCNFLFPDAQWHFVGTSISNRDKYLNWDFQKSEFQIEGEDVTVIATPGHTLSCVSVIVRDSNLGRIVGICGDLFESEKDIAYDHIWLEAGSEDPMAQRKHRLIIAERCLFIVPGHGPGFNMTEAKRVKLYQDLDCALKQQNTNNISKRSDFLEKGVKSNSLTESEKVYGNRYKQPKKRKLISSSKVPAKTAAMSTGSSKSQLPSALLPSISNALVARIVPQNFSSTSKQPHVRTIHRISHNDYEIQTSKILQNRGLQQLGGRGQIAKMHIIHPSGEKRLISFSLPEESCNVQELLDQVGVPFDDSSTILCVENPGEIVEYVVTVGSSVGESAQQNQSI